MLDLHRMQCYTVAGGGNLCLLMRDLARLRRRTSTFTDRTSEMESRDEMAPSRGWLRSSRDDGDERAYGYVRLRVRVSARSRASMLSLADGVSGVRVGAAF